MAERSPSLSRVLDLLMHLAKAGPTPGDELKQALNARWISFLSIMIVASAWGLIKEGRVLHPRQPDKKARVWLLTNDGRRFLRTYDELDPRAPFAAFETE